jgi:hypothetical protein
MDSGTTTLSYMGEILTGVGAILVSIFSFYKWKVNRNDKRHKIKATDVLKDSQIIYDCLDDIVVTTQVKRALLFVTHNDGDVIKPSSKLYSSCLYERYEPPFRSVKRLYQNYPLDIDYLKMLIDVMIHGYHNCIIAEMSEGLLKDIYVGEGVKFSKVIYIHDKLRKKIWYMSLATDNDIVHFNNMDYAIIMKNIKLIINIIEKYEK